MNNNEYREKYNKTAIKTNSYKLNYIIIKIYERTKNCK